MHIIGDGTAERTLDAQEIMRILNPENPIRPAMAHNDLMAPHPHHYARLAELGVVANLSWQWAGLTDAQEETYRHLLGPRRAERGLKTYGRFFDAGVTVAWNNDWPIDPLNE